MYYGERFNGYTHAAGALLAAGGAVTLVTQAASKGDPVKLAAFAVYGATLVLLYLVSTAYHSTRGRTKEVLRKLDYVAIYLFIAGSYTPLAWSLPAESGRTLLVAVWALAALGVVQEIFVARGARWTSLLIYLLMGWLGIVALEPLAAALTTKGFAVLLSGGIVYTAGIVFYLYDQRFPHWHGIWHCFVMAGSALHFATLFFFVA